MSVATYNFAAALARYAERTGHPFCRPAVVLFDMDGILYDSMPGHAQAWKKMCDTAGIDCTPEEFFAYEGRTGADTIDILIRRQFGRPATDAEKHDLYQVKSRNFKAMGLPPVMLGAPRAVAVAEALAPCVIVTGSGQLSILDRLDTDYPGAFPAERRVTAFDVTHGKPDPEPYLKGMAKVGARPEQSIAIDNAPLGVEAAVRSGAFTIGVTTGPLPDGALEGAGADIVVPSMDACADILEAFGRLGHKSH